VVGGQWNGAMGVALALVLVYPLVMGWMAREALKEVNLSANEMLGQLMPVVVPSVVMAIAVATVQWTIPANTFGPHLIRLLAAGIVGIIVYTGAVATMRRSLAAEVWEVVSWVVRPKRGVGLSTLVSREGVSAP
jgi:hypothetical protein